MFEVKRKGINPEERLTVNVTSTVAVVETVLVIVEGVSVKVVVISSMTVEKTS